MLHEGPAVAGSLRIINRLTLLRLLRELGPISKPELSKRSGISRPTTAKVIDELEREGLAERVGKTQSTTKGGKPGVLYRFNADGVKSGAIFLRVDAVQVAIIDGNARILGKLESQLGTDKHPESVIALIVALLADLLKQLGLTTNDLLGIGIGVPGLASVHSGIVQFAPHLPEWSDVPLCAILTERLHIETWVDNDCHVQALAERHFGLGQDGRNFISVQSGIGLSAAFYLNGTLYRGPGDTAGEVGHMIVQADGRVCECGSRGCWETIASTTWLVDAACQETNGRYCLPDWLRVAGWANQEYRSIQDIDSSMITRCAQAIFQSALKGQSQAIELVRSHAFHFGIGLVNLVNIFNPQRIIIWGDDHAAGELFLQTVQDVVKTRALKHPREQCEIVFSRLGQEVGLIGAGSLALNALFEGDGAIRTDPLKDKGNYNGQYLHSHL
jgi:predicted NBD/HSP70 family sugar kinase